MTEQKDDEDEKRGVLPEKRGFAFWIEFAVGVALLLYLIEVNVKSGGTAIPQLLFGLPALMITGQGSKIVEIFKR